MAVKKRTASPDWEDVHFFLELARLGTLSAAARSLGVTHATVGRRIAALEAILRVQLFDRHGGKFTLTTAGESAAIAAGTMADGAHAIRRMSAGPSDAVKGKVRVTATEVFGSFFLMSRMRGLVEKNPGLDIELVIQSRNLSLARRDVDLAIRHARPEGASVITRKIADYASNFYADRSYIEARRGEPLDFIGFTDDVNGQPTALHTIRAAGNQQRYSMKVNTLFARLAAARAGLGVGIVPKFVAHQYPDLVEVDVGVEPLVRELWLVAHPDVRAVARLRVTFDYIADAIAGARDILM
jgi:DNA-binding transcriptional LysR family regulator